MHHNARIKVTANFIQHFDDCHLMCWRKSFGCFKTGNTAPDNNDIFAFHERRILQYCFSSDSCLDSRNIGKDRFSTRRKEHCFHIGSFHCFGIRCAIETNFHSRFFELSFHGFDKFREHSLVRWNRGKVDSSAQTIRSFKQDRVEPAVGKNQSSLHTGRTAANYCSSAAGTVLYQFFLSPFEFTAKDRVQRASERQTVVQNAETFHTAQTLANQNILSSACLQSPIRICQLTAGNTDKIDIFLFQHLFRY